MKSCCNMHPLFIVKMAFFCSWWWSVKCLFILYSRKSIVAAVVGDETARVQACASYRLTADQTNISFLGPYQSVIVGSVNYTYHAFGKISIQTWSRIASITEIRFQNIYSGQAINLTITLILSNMRCKHKLQRLSDTVQIIQMYSVCL